MEKKAFNRSLWSKLHMAKMNIGKVAKNATNPHFKKTYADINALLETVEPILHENGLVLLQPVKDHIVFTQIIDIDSGDMIESWMEPPEITDPQKLLGAITYFRRGTLQFQKVSQILTLLLSSACLMMMGAIS